MKKNQFMTMVCHGLLLAGLALAFLTDLGVSSLKVAPMNWIMGGVMLFSAVMFGYEIRSWVLSASTWRERQYKPADVKEWTDFVAVALLFSGICVPKVWGAFIPVNFVIFVMLGISLLLICATSIVRFIQARRSLGKNQSSRFDEHKTEKVLP